MPSYLITGVNRGIGWGFLQHLSADTNNTVIGTVRNKAATEKRVAEELDGRANIHILEVELTDYESIKASVGEVTKLTGGKLDYLIANAGFISDWSSLFSLGKLGQSPKELEDDLIYSFKVNAVGPVHLFNLYLPLILKGDAKKAIAITSGMADLDLINDYRIDVAGPYSISKGALNVAVSKFHAQYADQGVLFMGICPGTVETGHYDDLSEEAQDGAMKLTEKFNKYAPGTKPKTPEAAVVKVLEVVYGSSLENGRGGAYISHLGTKRWL
ncbi:Short chain dehydrogenase virK like protein [Verticillium longisporum]|nr:Short chain dehydrogenase virK like protein [Verticillium longisporum]